MGGYCNSSGCSRVGLRSSTGACRRLVCSFRAFRVSRLCCLHASSGTPVFSRCHCEQLGWIGDRQHHFSILSVRNFGFLVRADNWQGLGRFYICTRVVYLKENHLVTSRSRATHSPLIARAICAARYHVLNDPPQILVFLSHNKARIFTQFKRFLSAVDTETVSIQD